MRSSNIGGQAVIEGIMMRHKDEYAIAVRKPKCLWQSEGDETSNTERCCELCGFPGDRNKMLDVFGSLFRRGGRGEG